MTTRKKPTKSGKTEVHTLKLKKQTLKDLGAEGKGIKGGLWGSGSKYCGSGTGI